MNTSTKTLVLACAFGLASGVAFAQGECSMGKTVTDGVLTIATGNPAYFPWVIDDNPASGQGFEAAVAYSLAEHMGFSNDQVAWTRTTFDQAIQPGAKNYDLNMQQYSITEERKQTIDFSAPYYTAAAAVLVRQPTLDAGASATLDSLKALKWGAGAGTTAGSLIASLIGPDSQTLLYDDNADVTEALKAGQIDAALLDLPSALFTAAVLLDDGAVLGQFAPDASGDLDQFGAVMEKDSALKPCVDAALAEMAADGSLAGIEEEWLQGATGVPVIE
ncbi:MAG: amino acid ABC transporter substrate-binding protein [Rhodobacteraceae bacterium]|nr:amino acid ABC transporter substrate-binding protein [Paracoccaceae bacterium]